MVQGFDDPIIRNIQDGFFLKKRIQESSMWNSDECFKGITSQNYLEVSGFINDRASYYKLQHDLNTSPKLENEIGIQKDIYASLAIVMKIYEYNAERKLFYKGIDDNEHNFDEKKMVLNNSLLYFKTGATQHPIAHAENFTKEYVSDLIKKAKELTKDNVAYNTSRLSMLEEILGLNKGKGLGI